MFKTIAKLFKIAAPQPPASTYEHMCTVAARRPLNVNIETTTVCNSRCCFCGYPKTRRATTVMDMDLFKRILEQYQALGGGPIGFSPLMSDPLMDPLLPERISLLKDPGYKFWTHMFTNAIGFSNFSSAQMERFLQLDLINISMGGPTREAYLAMYKVNKFDAVVENVRALHRLIRSVGAGPRIAIHFRIVDPQALRDSDVYKEFVGYGFTCSDVQNQFSNFGGTVTQQDVPEGVTIVTPDNAALHTDCLIPQAECTITANGDVVACGCFDADGATIVGNIQADNLRDIWTGKRYRDFRTGFSRKAMPGICRGCASYMSVADIFGNPGLADYRPDGDIFWYHLR